jgi:hypothetical protein
LKASRISAAIILSIFFIGGCAYLTTRQPVRYRSYALNVEEQSTAGAPMIYSEIGRQARGSRGYGLTEEFDRWESFDYPSRNRVREELIYEGRSGNMILLTYRKSRNDVPVFSERLSIDISSNDTITVRKFRIRILRVTDEYVRFIVLSDK